MLLQFTVENVLSFRDQAVFSLLAAPEVEHDPRHVVEVPGLPAPVLRVAALYGANASGKSNIVKAIEMIRRLVLDGTRPGKPIDIVPFKLDADAEKRPSRFEFELWIEGCRWSYGLACTKALVEAEWLYRDAGQGEQVVYERSQPADEGSPIVIGEALELATERRRFWEFVAEGTRPAQPFLAEARERNVKELEPLLGFWSNLLVADAGVTLVELPALMSEYPLLLEFASELLTHSGTGIDALELVTEPSEHVAGPDIPQLRFRHAAASGQVTLDASEESDGTRRIVDLSPLLWAAFVAGRSIVIDELDHSLHTMLSRALVERFLAADASAAGQMVFTTHDTNLLDLALLPRDSIWFVEKGRAGGSTLYSLAEFKGEQLEQLGRHLEQGYLSGRFGAIPFLGDPARLSWTKRDAS